MWEKLVKEYGTPVAPIHTVFLHTGIAAVTLSFVRNKVFIKELHNRVTVALRGRLANESPDIGSNWTVLGF